LKYYGGFSIFEVYNLPIMIRNWFAQRLLKQLKEEEEAYKKASRKK